MTINTLSVSARLLSLNNPTMRYLHVGSLLCLFLCLTEALGKRESQTILICQILKTEVWQVVAFIINPLWWVWPPYFIHCAIFTLLSILSGAEGCGNCVFPFNYLRRIHDRCTTFDGDDRPWCITGDNIGDWEYCSDPSCPGMAANPAEVVTPHPLNLANPGVCCKYNVATENVIKFCHTTVHCTVLDQ